MARKIPSCYNCVFAYLDKEVTLKCYEAKILNWPACANNPESYGRMTRTPDRGICPNYRSKPKTPEGDVREITLGDGIVAYVDAADFDWLNQWTWYLGCGGYAYRLEKGKVILMHRQIMQPPKGLVVHHKSRNKLDNTRENLDNVTPAENTRHRIKKRNTSSRFWGLSYIKTRHKYRVYVCHDGEHCFCGEFTDEIKAAQAHDYKAVALKGEFARLNFPEEWPPERRAEVYAQGAAERQRLEVRTREKETTKKPPRKTRGAADPRATKPKRATGHKSRTTKKARAETLGRSGGKRQTRSKTAKPRATGDKRRATT